MATANLFELLPPAVILHVYDSLARPSTDPPREIKDSLALASTCRLLYELYTQPYEGAASPIDRSFQRLADCRWPSTPITVNRAARLVCTALTHGGPRVRAACERDRTPAFERAVAKRDAGHVFCAETCLFHQHWLPAPAAAVYRRWFADMCCGMHPWAYNILIHPLLVDAVLYELDDQTPHAIQTLTFLSLSFISCSPQPARLFTRDQYEKPAFHTAPTLDCFIRDGEGPLLGLPHSEDALRVSLIEEDGACTARVRFDHRAALQSALRILLRLDSTPLLRYLAVQFTGLLRISDSLLTNFFVQLCQHHPTFWHTAAAPIITSALRDCLNLGGIPFYPRSAAMYAFRDTMISLVPQRHFLCLTTHRDLLEGIRNKTPSAAQDDAAFWLMAISLLDEPELLRAVIERYFGSYASLVHDNIKVLVRVKRQLANEPPKNRHIEFLVSVGLRPIYIDSGQRFAMFNNLEDIWPAIQQHVLTWVLKPAPLQEEDE